ncbi:MAG: membrane protein TolA [Methylibium sp. NZG]|nr:MAG: membrane protein TolA [Methylibium sp. NZG]
MPHRPPGMGAGLVLALIAHALLMAALAFSVRWNTSPPAGVEAELWAAVPQIAAPRAAAPEPAPVPVEVKPAPPPPPPPVAKPEPAPVPDAQIAIEKAKREEEKKRADDEKKREEAEKRAEKEKRDAINREQALAKEEIERKKKEEAAKLKQEEQKLAAAREANLKRILGQAGATGDAGTTGTAARSAGPSAGYAGRIRARIQPNIVFGDSVSGNPVATVEVRLSPDGTINSKRLTKSSGVKAWDDAVLRAVEKTEVLPRDTDGRVPPVIEIDFRPYD